MTSNPTPIDFGAPRDGGLQLARGFAIEEYSKLESALSRLLASLLDTTWTKASIVFFSLINTRSRNSIFKALITATHGDRYDMYWNGRAGAPGIPRASGLLALIRQLDDERNRIVHWQTVRNFSKDDGGTQTSFEQLMKPEFWFREPAAAPTSIQVDDLRAFIGKTDFVTRSVVMFRGFTAEASFPESARRIWAEIFQQPVSYPPPDTHPLSPNYRADG
jgi:hypothetical protein